VQLKSRHDNIPNLLEAVKGYMGHERQTLENITKARNLAAQASGVANQAQAEANLNRALGQFFLVVENYPDLKANQNFLALQEELASTENKIGFARQFYNDQVLQFNNKIQMFPSNVVAGGFSFKEAEFFEVEEAAEREAPKVSFP
jgi:LemA protein